MLKAYKSFIIFCILWLFSCDITLHCFAFGKWYKDRTRKILPIDGPLLPGNKAFENTVKRWNFRSTRRNLLFDEKARVFYIKNFFPYHGDVPGFERPVLQLGDIFVRKGLLTSEDLKFSSDPVGRIVATINFINAGILYLRFFKLQEATNALESIRNEFCDPQKWNAELLSNLLEALSDESRMRPVWDCMHTERLLIFDKYYNPGARALETPRESLVFVSYYDMCETCEALMEVKLSEMGEVREEDFRGEHYKILVGSFHEYKGSRGRNSTESMLLKVPLSDTVAPSASAPISQPERKRRKPVVVIPPKIHTKNRRQRGKALILFQI